MTSIILIFLLNLLNLNCLKRKNKIAPDNIPEPDNIQESLCCQLIDLTL